MKKKRYRIWWYYQDCSPFQGNEIALQEINDGILGIVHYKIK